MYTFYKVDTKNLSRPRNSVKTAKLFNYIVLMDFTGRFVIDTWLGANTNFGQRMMICRISTQKKILISPVDNLPSYLISYSIITIVRSSKPFLSLGGFAFPVAWRRIDTRLYDQTTRFGDFDCVSYVDI